MQPSDIIVGINGQPVKDGDQLVATISAAQPGDKVEMKVLRDGKPVEVSVRIGDRSQVVADKDGPGNEPAEGPEGETMHARLGVNVQNLTDSDREQMGLKAGSVVIASVEPGSFAEDIGLQKGDVLVEINRHHVTSGADVRNLMQAAKPGEAMAFKLMRNAGGNWASVFAAGTVPAQQ